VEAEKDVGAVAVAFVDLSHSQISILQTVRACMGSRKMLEAFTRCMQILYGSFWNSSDGVVSRLRIDEARSSLEETWNRADGGYDKQEDVFE
jgi:hypothetical protein